MIKKSPEKGHWGCWRLKVLDYIITDLDINHTCNLRSMDQDEDK